MKTLLVDDMHCLYNEEFQVNKELLKVLNSYPVQKILDVNGFREKGRKALQEKFEAFSLEEEGIKKSSVGYWKKFLLKYSLHTSNVLYFDHDAKNVATAQSLGILSFHYTSVGKIKEFLEKNFK